jgi:hypothetical protein
MLFNKMVERLTTGIICRMGYLNNKEEHQRNDFKRRQKSLWIHHQTTLGKVFRQYFEINETIIIN